MHEWRRLFVEPRKHGSPSQETNEEYRIGNATFFKVTKPLVRPTKCVGHRLVGGWRFSYLLKFTSYGPQIKQSH